MYDESIPMDDYLDSIYNAALHISKQQDVVESAKKAHNKFSNNLFEISRGRVPQPEGLTLEQLRLEEQRLKNHIETEFIEEQKRVEIFKKLCLGLRK